MAGWPDRPADAAVKDLREIKSLTNINLCGTEITKAGADQLKTALPHADVFR